MQHEKSVTHGQQKKTIHTQTHKNVTRGSNLGCTLSIMRTACGFRQYVIANT